MGLAPSKPTRTYPLVHPGYNVPQGPNPGLYLPPPLRNHVSPPHKKKKKKGSSQQEQLAEAYVQGWRAGHNGMGPQPSIQPGVNVQQPRETLPPAISMVPAPGPPPSIVTQQTQTTPFTAGGFTTATQTEPPTALVVGQTQAAANANLAQVLQPLPAPNPAVYGPPPAPYPLPPLNNPLPTPPRDLYELSPYNTLLDLPQTTALLTSNYAQMGGVPPPSYGRRKGTRTGGLLRTLTGRGRKEDDVHFVPVFINAAGPQAPRGLTPQESGSTVDVATEAAVPRPAAAPVVGLNPPADNAAPAWYRSAPAGPAAAATPIVGPLAGPAPGLVNPRPASWYQGGAPAGAPVMPQPAVPVAEHAGAIRFHGATPQYAAFLNYSPHRILYNDLSYPTAMHLHEAMKFLTTAPALAEQIRNCPDVTQLYTLSEDLTNEYPDSVRADWPEAYIPLMQEAVLYKFRQHANLRDLLLKTGSAPLIYADEEDSFWGEGPPGRVGLNNLGLLLQRVRGQLLSEGGLQR